MKELFYKFLVEKGLLFQFLQNCEQPIEKILEGLPESYIWRAFTFSATKEGYDFWNGVDDEWRRILCNKK